MKVRLSPTWSEVTSDGTSPVVLLLHGFGSNEDDLPGVAAWLPDGVAWASPRGPVDMDWGGAAWFPLELGVEPDQASIEAATAGLWDLIETHVPPTAPLVPLGFSQGGFMALQVLREHPERVLATVVLSGFLTQRAHPGDESLASRKPPVFWGRGTQDTLIWPEAIGRLTEWLPEHTTLTARVYDDLGHGVNDEEMTDVREFLTSHIQASPIQPPRA